MSYGRDAGKDEAAEMREEELLIQIEEDAYNEYREMIEDQVRQQEIDEENEMNAYLTNFNIGDEVIIPIVIERTTNFLHRRWSCGVISEINENNNEIKIKIYDFECDEDAYYADFPEENIELGTDAYFWIKDLSLTTEYLFDTTDYNFVMYKKEQVLNDDFKLSIFNDGIDEFYHNDIAPFKNAWDVDDDN